MYCSSRSYQVLHLVTGQLMSIYIIDWLRGSLKTDRFQTKLKFYLLMVINWVSIHRSSVWLIWDQGLGQC